MGATTYDYAYAVAIQKNGRIVVSGVSYAPSGDFAVARYLANGTLDSTFGTGGKVVSDLGTASDDEARAEAIQKDGKILVGGYSHASGNFDFAVARYTTLGVLDSRFGSGGRVLDDLGSASDDEGYAMALQKDGKIVAAGRSNAAGTFDFAVVRLLTK